VVVLVELVQVEAIMLAGAIEVGGVVVAGAHQEGAVEADHEQMPRIAQRRITFTHKAPTAEADACGTCGESKTPRAG